MLTIPVCFDCMSLAYLCLVWDDLLTPFAMYASLLHFRH